MPPTRSVSRGSSGFGTIRGAGGLVVLVIVNRWDGYSVCRETQGSARCIIARSPFRCREEPVGSSNLPARATSAQNWALQTRRFCARRGDEGAQEHAFRSHDVNLFGVHFERVSSVEIFILINPTIFEPRAPGRI